MSATNRGAKRKTNDYYPTPAKAIVPFLRAWTPRRNATWLEPSAGNGAIIRVLAGQLQESNIILSAVEIEKEVSFQQPIEPLECVQWHLGIDFLNWEAPQRFDYVIGNPPYSLAMEFILKCINIADEVAFLLRLNFLGSQERYLFHKAYPADIYVLPTRPSFVGKGGTDNCEYAWFVWSERSRREGGRIIMCEP